MSWADDIDLAMQRGGSPYTAADLIRWLREGRAGMAVTDDMHASWVFEDGACNVGHVHGRWNGASMRWLIGCMKRDMEARGVTSWRWSGRAGWARFLRSKGFKP